MDQPTIKTELTGGPDEYLVTIKNRVTRQFCIFYFVLSILAVPSAYIGRPAQTFSINLTALLFYAIPFFMVLFTARYQLAAKLITCIAMVVIVMNAVVADFDISPTTVIWYFVYLVFAHLVLNFGWALFVASVGGISVAVFSYIHLNAIEQLSRSYCLEYPVIVGSPLAMLVACVAMLYLLTVYKKIRDVMIHNFVSANRESNRLLGVLSHDMRNYLGAVQNVQELIMEEYNSEEHKGLIQNITMIGDASSRGMALVDEVVSVSRDMAEQKIFLEKTEMRDFLLPLLERYRVIARAKGIVIASRDSGEEIMAMINRNKFSRVIENLLSNAVKFCREGDRITISTKREKSCVVVMIADTGIGIPPELQKNIFEPFSIAGRTGTAKEKTYGLGMSIVKKIVELHGGSIELRSEENKGTTVYVRVAAA